MRQKASPSILRNSTPKRSSLKQKFVLIFVCNLLDGEPLKHTIQLAVATSIAQLLP